MRIAFGRAAARITNNSQRAAHELIRPGRAAPLASPTVACEAGAGAPGGCPRCGPPAGRAAAPQGPAPLPPRPRRKTVAPPRWTPGALLAPDLLAGQRLGHVSAGAAVCSGLPQASELRPLHRLNIPPNTSSQRMRSASDTVHTTRGHAAACTQGGQTLTLVGLGAGVGALLHRGCCGGGGGAHALAGARAAAGAARVCGVSPCRLCALEPSAHDLCALSRQMDLSMVPWSPAATTKPPLGEQLAVLAIPSPASGHRSTWSSAPRSQCSAGMLEVDIMWTSRKHGLHAHMAELVAALRRRRRHHFQGLGAPCGSRCKCDRPRSVPLPQSLLHGFSVQGV